ncbi:hypothetical protein BDV96DRAFT_624663 [Lophiotrema nucula]|uniref:Uncharacterized protein n=1 Tax=Lophiotrema nucula TaxID=690887 RepID=A0A6A5YPR8_9PLEO|nr:hypothetical protein BDV96DRAFT_624663 [Lophiotrema nucula]
MAEVVGAIASGLTVLQAAGATGKLGKKVLDARHAERNVKVVAEKVEEAKATIQCTEKQIRALESRNASKLAISIPASINSLGAHALTLEQSLGGLHKRKHIDGELRVSKLKWLRNGDKVEKSLKALQKDILQLGPSTSALTLSACLQMQADLRIIKQSLDTEPAISTQRLLPTKANLYACCTASIVYTDSLLYLLGILLIACSGVNPHCRNPRCNKCQQDTVYYFSYVFPTWVLAKALIGTLQYSQTQGLRLRNVHIPNVRRTTDKIFTLVMRGDLRGIREEFYEKRSASPFDVDSRGNTLLWYAISAFNENMEAVCDFLRYEGLAPLHDGSTVVGRLLDTFKYAWRLFRDKDVAFKDVRRLCLFFDETANDKPGASSVSLKDDEFVREEELCLNRPLNRTGSSCNCAEDWAYSSTVWHLRHTNRVNAPSLKALEHFRMGISPFIKHNTHLLEAVIHHNESGVRMLLHGNMHEDPETALNAQNEYGLTPLHYAVFHNQHRCLPLLLEAGADCSITSFREHGLLHFAAAHADARTMETLATSKLLVNAQLVKRPVVEKLYLATLRWECGSKKFRPMNESWWEAWEMLLERVGKEDDVAWKEVMPEVNVDGLDDPWNWGGGEDGAD